MRAILIVAIFPLALACSMLQGDGDPPPPNYNGPVPGAKGQYAIHELEGKTLHDETGVFGGGDWTIGPFGVVPNPVNQKGPVVKLTRGTETRWLPIETDGDVADLVLRATGERSPIVSGKTSVAYRNTLKLPND